MLGYIVGFIAIVFNFFLIWKCAQPNGRPIHWRKLEKETTWIVLYKIGCFGDDATYILRHQGDFGVDLIFVVIPVEMRLERSDEFRIVDGQMLTTRKKPETQSV